LSENAIEVKNISKTFKIYHEKHDSVFEAFTAPLRKKRSFEQIKVLDNVSFSVKKGEMLGIIGLNGSGKTTLLRLISKIYQPDSGQIIVNGKIIPFLELGVGFQPELTAYDNIILYGVILGMSKKQIKEKADDIIKFAELEKFLDTKLKNFSSGMYARLAFSTAIQVDPDILLVDEILSVGDLPFQKKSFETFLSFKERGKSIVFVSHNLESVKTLCDNAIFINKGKIQASGNPELVIQEYKKNVGQ
jgi:lipopolysaccharide transport system ATP-binding protein